MSFTLSCACGASFLISYGSALEKPTGNVCPGCGQRYDVVGDGQCFTITLPSTKRKRQRQGEWHTYHPSVPQPELTQLKELALRCLLMKFARSDAERYGFPL